MAEVTSGENLTVLVLDERETRQLSFALWEWDAKRRPEAQRHYALYAVMEALGVFDIEVV